MWNRALVLLGILGVGCAGAAAERSVPVVEVPQHRCIPGGTDESAIERARDGIRAPGLPAQLVFTVQSLVGPVLAR